MKKIQDRLNDLLEYEQQSFNLKRSQMTPYKIIESQTRITVYKELLTFINNELTKENKQSTELIEEYVSKALTTNEIINVQKNYDFHKRLNDEVRKLKESYTVIYDYPYYYLIKKENFEIRYKEMDIDKFFEILYATECLEVDFNSFDYSTSIYLYEDLDQHNLYINGNFKVEHFNDYYYLTDLSDTVIIKKSTSTEFIDYLDDMGLLHQQETD